MPVKIAAKIAALAGAGLLLSSCASTLLGGPSLGIDRASLPPSLYPIHDSAQAGDKQAQYELGLAYMLGAGVPRDCGTAKKLLRSAASSSGGRMWVYSPPVGNGTTGRVIPVDTGPKVPGLAKAKALLDDPEFCQSSSFPSL